MELMLSDEKIECVGKNMKRVLLPPSSQAKSLEATHERGFAGLLSREGRGGIAGGRGAAKGGVRGGARWLRRGNGV